MSSYSDYHFPQLTPGCDKGSNVISERLVLAVCQIIQTMRVIRRSILLVTLRVLPDQKEPKALCAYEADNKTNQNTSKAGIVTRSVRAINMFISKPLKVAPGTNLRIKHQWTNNVSKRVSNERNSRINCLFRMTCDVGSSETNALCPSRGEEVDQVEADDSTGSARRW